MSLASWLWGVNLHYLTRRKIDVPSLIRYPGRTSPHQPPHYLSTYRLATVLSAVYGTSLVFFWLVTRRRPAAVLDWDWLPLSLMILLAGLFLLPLKSRDLASGGRARFLATLRRVSVGGIAEAKDGKFGDILLADVLTSYAKVFGDLYVALCMVWSTGGPGSATARPDRRCGGTVAVPLIMAVPSMIRLRQCLIEYGRVRRGRMDERTGWGGQHLANALKYFTAFPVIVLSALQRSLGPSPSLYRAWVAACIVNSLYSFYWDVTKDWDLTLFASAREREAPDHAFGLRRRLHLGPPATYYGVIALDLLLRCTWSLKLSPHLDHIADFESSLFIIEFLEVFRRWVWIFFRVETEWIRSSATTTLPVDQPDIGEGILLGEYDSRSSSSRSRYKDDESD